MQFPLKASPVERAASRPQKLSTKLPGKRPVLPFLCNVPLYQPSSRFLCTNTMSPSFSSISASLCGGYGTTTRYLRRQKRKDLVSLRLSLRLMGAARHQIQKPRGKMLLETSINYIFSYQLYLMQLHFLPKTQYDGEISGQPDRRLDQDVLWSQTMKAGRYGQMAGLLVVVPAPSHVPNLRQGLGRLLPALHLPLL